MTIANPTPHMPQAQRRAQRPLLASATLALCLGLGALGSAQAAQNYSKAVYDGAKNELKAMYKAQREACDKLSGNAKDVCDEEAKGQEKIALAQLDYNQEPSERRWAKLYEAQYEARYEIAEEKCDDRSGQDKDVCVQAAKTERDKAKADLKLAKKMVSASEDALDTKARADYKLAREKCDMLKGDAQNTCLASAKARFNIGW